MSIINKFQEIIDIQKKSSSILIGTLNNSISNSEIEKIERLLEEKLPEEIKELYSFANGQNNDGSGLFFGEEFCKAEKIMQELNYSKSLINPGRKFISNPEKSEKLIEQIVDFYARKAPKNRLFGLQKSWYKMEFECGPNSFGGPYIYETENTPSQQRKILQIDTDEIENTIIELHNLEKTTYKWDELKFVLFSNGKYEFKRSLYDFDNEIPFTSTPKNAIKKKYFHYKWLPIFSDYGGNYIGIDLDPDVKGKRGQVINYGRDEEDMFVLANNLEDLFDKILIELANEKNYLLKSENRLHEILKEISKKSK